MNSGTSPGQPKALPDFPITAERIVTLLEAMPLEDIAQVDGAMAGLMRSMVNLEELLAGHEKGITQTVAMLIRIRALIRNLQARYPGRWDPVPPIKHTNTPPNVTQIPKDGPPEG